MSVLRLDYATFNFEAGSMSRSKASRLLAGDGVDFCWRQRGLSDTSPSVSPLGLFWQDNNGFAEMPHKLQVSGVGCEHFLASLPILRDGAPCRFSRLDFAFDIPVNKSVWRDFLVNAYRLTLTSERKHKRFSFQGTGEEMTVYIGSRSCAKYFRIYNKSLEDREYRLLDDSGSPVELDDDSYIIRYEVELKRFKDSHRVFDPSPLFDLYYSLDQKSDLVEYIKDLWRSFGDEIILPEDFDNLPLVCYSEISKNKNFVQNGADTETVYTDIQSTLHEFPRSFERTLQFVTDRYGKYIPYIMCENSYLQSCLASCERNFGFSPDFYFEPSKPSAFYELDGLEEPAFDALDGDQMEIYFGESEVIP